jgi:WD40 repeat protein
VGKELKAHAIRGMYGVPVVAGGITLTIGMKSNWPRLDSKTKWRAVTIGIVLIVFLPGIARSESRALQFVKEIGVGWRLGKSGWMSFVSFSPDGTMVASDGARAPDDTMSNNLTFWSFPEGRPIKSLPGRPTAISDDWKYYATPNSVREIETGKPVISLGDKVNAIFAFSPEGRYVAESLPGIDVHNSAIRVVDLATGKQVSAFGTHHPCSIAISPDGVTLASGYWDVVMLWNMSTGERIAVLRGFGRYVEGLSFSRDGRVLAGDTDTDAAGLQIWEVSSQTRVRWLKIGGGDMVPAFSPDGRLIALGVYGIGTVVLIDVGTGKILDQAKVSEFGCGSVAFSPDGRFLITPSTGGLIKWPYDTGGTIRVFEISAP